MTQPPMRLVTTTASAIAAKEFPPLQYLVDGLWPAGYTLLVAAPKVGKSWLALQLASAYATGSPMFGYLSTGEPRPVLYLALEDGERRLQARMKMTGATASEHIEFVTDLGNAPALPGIAQWLEEKRGQSPLVIVDIIGKIMPIAPKGADRYLTDYKFSGDLKKLVDIHEGASLVGIHHTNKREHSGDWMDKASGTNGIVGAADTVIAIQRDRGSTRATFSMTSRDVGEIELGIQFIDECVWHLEGESISDAKAAAAKAKAAEGLGPVMLEILDIIRDHPDGITPKAIKEKLPEHQSKIDVYMKRLFDESKIEKLERGLYALTTSTKGKPVRSVSLLESKLTNSQNLQSHLGNDCQNCHRPLEPSLVEQGLRQHTLCARAREVAS